MTIIQPEPSVPTYTKVPTPPTNVSLVKVQDLLTAQMSAEATARGLVKLMRLPNDALPAARAVLQNVLTSRVVVIDPHRAAYVVAATRRVYADARHGIDTNSAMRNENNYFSQHENAQIKRQLAAHQVFEAQKQWGPLLGWHAKMDAYTSPACRAADGHNFYAAQGTIIGLPGTVHPHCRCIPTRPFYGATLVNQTVTGEALRKEAAA